MKNIQTPAFRPRTDGIKFQPPPSAHNFQLPAIRFTDAPLTSTLTYTLDERDHEYLELCSANNITGDPVNAPITPRVLIALMSAFETEAYRKLMLWYNEHQRKLQLQREYEQQLQQGGGNPKTNAEIVALQQQQQKKNQDPLQAITGAINHTSQIVSSPNMPGVLEHITIQIPEVLKDAAKNAAGVAEDHHSKAEAASLLKHAAITDAKIAERIHQSVKGHWLEKRKATGNALMSVYRPLPNLNGTFSNKVIGSEDEPFCSRDSNPLVTWRPSSNVAAMNNNSTKSNTNSNTTILSENQKQTLDNAMDREVMLRYLKNAVGMMRAVVEREELRLSHAHALVAELALARKCRQVQAGVFSAPNAILEAAIRKEKRFLKQKGSEMNDDDQTEQKDDLVPLFDSTNARNHNQKEKERSSKDTLLTQREQEVLQATLADILPQF